MMRSLYSGVSGLKTHQTKMDVIGNNIANVNTTAYKSQSITFSELMYQTTQNASGPNATTGTAGTNAKQIGLGVQSAAISTSITSAGSSQTTGNPFDIRITGDSFFVVSDGSNNYFTRDGSFYVDAAGNLAMSSTGYNVMGWGVDPETGLVKQDTVTPLRVMSAENLTYPPEATSQSYLSGIIDKNDTDVTSESGKTVNLNFYDNLGYSYTAKISIHSTATEGQYYMQLDDLLNADGVSLSETFGVPLSDMVNLGASGNVKVNETLAPATQNNADGTSSTAVWNNATGIMTVTTYTPQADGSVTTTTQDYTQTQLEDMAGDPANNQEALKSIYGASIDPSIVAMSFDATSGKMTITEKTVQGGIVTYNTNTGLFDNVNGEDTVVLDFEDDFVNGLGETTSLGNFSDIEIDLSTTSRFDNNGTSTVGATSGDLDGRGTGRKLGEMSSIAIANDGTISASYSNGMSKVLGQIAVAEFTNPSGLQKEGDNMYSATQNSGDFDGIGINITTSSGSYMTTGVLEMSNVDLSTEFTEMITTQRGFQANSRIITTSDSMLEELVNLKR
ncbi:MAG: flagellar hook-basal body complex protein [Lachnospiraceae bacterium]|nr:flagellar hook-basal body complex protein [Lachnospiraceae bacterium]MBR3684499.1 flagellar hook-basal body complex protein [Lachnospiraceae bacterium]